MSPEFEQVLRDELTRLKTTGFGAEDALREAERFCARNIEEFNPDGRGIVESVYGGTFKARHGGNGMAFTPTPAVAPAGDAEDVSAEATGD